MERRLVTLHFCFYQFVPFPGYSVHQTVAKFPGFFCRCPVVSTRCGGPEDYIRDGENGRLVRVGDVGAMTDAILDVLALDEAAWRRMSEAAYDMSRAFDWDQSAELLEKALLEYRTTAVRSSSGAS